MITIYEQTVGDYVLANSDCATLNLDYVSIKSDCVAQNDNYLSIFGAHMPIS